MLEPRLDPDEIEYFKDFMSKKANGTKMVEWGSGGSTTMFLPYFTSGELISIEHNEEWFDKVVNEISTGDYSEDVKQNFVYVLAKPKVDIRFYGYGIPHEENPAFAADYINPVSENFSIWDADIYFVDGICRGPILSMIHNMRRNTPMMFDATNDTWVSDKPSVFIHDYFGREERAPWYEWASKMYGSVEQVGSTLARLHW